MKATSYILLALLLIAATLTKAQTRVTDTTGAELSQKLGILPGRAQKIAVALNYHMADLKTVMTNRSIPAGERQKIATRLMGERWQQVRLATTPEELKKILAYFAVVYLQKSEKLKQQNKTKAITH